MYYKFIGKLFIILFFMTAVSCNDPSIDEDWGDMVLSSEFDFTSSSIVGYNFELMTYTRFPTSGDPVPDIILDKFTQPSGEVFPGFSSPANDAGFALVSESVKAMTPFMIMNPDAHVSTSINKIIQRLV